MASPEPVHVDEQPFTQRSEVAAGQRFVEVGQVRPHPLPHLCGEQIPERVRGEVADHPAAPVDVLEDALVDVEDLDAEQPQHPGVPRVGQLVDRERALEERRLELEAQRDVEVVGGLVGFRPDQRRRDRVQRPVEAVDLEGPAEVTVEDRYHPLAEGAAAPHQVLPHAALRLVNAERDGFLEHAGIRPPAHACLVEGVPELVQAGVDRERHLVLAEIGRHPQVAHAGRLRERMHRDVEPPRAGIEPDAFQHVHEGGPLGGDVDRWRERRVGGSGRGGDQRRELRGEIGEQRAQLGDGHLGLEVVDERVVGMREGREAGGIFAALFDLEGERVAEAAVIAGFAGFHPRLLTQGRRAGDVGEQALRHAHGLLVVAPDDVDFEAPVVVGSEAARPRLEPDEQASDLRIGDRAMDQAFDRGAGLPAGRSAGGRHVRVLVPEEDGERVLEPADIGQARAQPLELRRSVRHRELRRAVTDRRGRRRRRVGPPGLRARSCRRGRSRFPRAACR